MPLARKSLKPVKAFGGSLMYVDLKQFSSNHCLKRDIKLMESFTKRVGTLMLSWTLAVVGVFGQTVDDICSQNVRQLGGLTAVAKVKSLQLQQVVVTQGGEMPVTTLLVPGVAFYQRVKSPLGTMMVCAYKDKGWTFNSAPTPQTEPMPAGMVESYIIGSKFLGPLFDYYVNKKTSDVVSLAFVGEKDLDGEACFELEVRYRSGYKMMVCMSRKDGLIRQTTSPAGVIRYEDYRNVGGVKVPFMMMTSTRQGLVLTRVTSAQVNVDLEGKLLAMP